MIVAIAAVLLLTSAAGPGVRPVTSAGGLVCLRGGDPDELWVPTGRFRMGSGHGYREEAPAHDVAVEGFWIDRHEVTNAQFARFVAATGYVTTAERPDGAGGSIVFRPPEALAVPVDPRDWWRFVAGANWRHPEGPGSGIARRQAWPVVHVSQEDARAYAAWAGRALPTEEEFEYAARAGAMAPEAAELQPASDAANTFQGRFPSRDLGLDGHVGAAPVGCYKANGFGLHDMIGNVWEWTSSPYTADHRPYMMVDEVRPDRALHVIKGGSFLCAPDYCARYRPSARQGHPAGSSTSHIGFRTVRRS